MSKKKTGNGVSRRDILKLGLAGVGIAALGPLTKHLPGASGSPADLTRLVVVNCFGGNDTMNMLPPVTLSPYYERRPSLAVAEGQGLSLASGPAATTARTLHPKMPNLQRLWEDGDVAFIDRVGYPKANLSHFESQDIMSHGIRNDFFPLGIPESGWIARYADENAPTPLGAVSVGVGRPVDFVGGTSNPFLVKSLSSFQVRSDSRYRYNHPFRVDRIQNILGRFPDGGEAGDAKVAIRQAHELADQIQAAVTDYESTVTYTTDRPARYLKDVATLVQAGFETRIFYTGFGGFDNHSDQGRTDGNHPTLLGRLDDGLGSFAADMKEMGIWDDTVVVVLTEFGRRNYENGSVGTDHGHAFAEIVLGGAVRGGFYGPEPTEEDLNRDYPTYAVDFRSVYREILDRHLGADPDPVFPEPLEKDETLGIL